MQNTTFQSYVGTKIIRAREHPGAHGRPGYEVIYEDGYKSWSPADTFERCYRLITTQEKELALDHTQEAN